MIGKTALTLAALATPVALSAAPALAAPTAPAPAAVAPAAVAPVAVAPPADQPATASSLVTLTTADNGRRLRVHRGARIFVRLAVDPAQDPSTWWRGIEENGQALRVRPQTEMPIRGTTLGHYEAIARGHAMLSSSRPVCPQHSGPVCHAMLGWSVSVDVR